MVGPVFASEELLSVTTSPALAPHRPTWEYCGYGADSIDPVGCPGIRVSGNTACLAHLSDAKRRRYLDELSDGADVNHRGTPFGEDLLKELLKAVRARNGQPILGRVMFEEATFLGDANFHEVRFKHDAHFERVTFARDANFISATFDSYAEFSGATFTGDARFQAAKFGGTQFKAATFTTVSSFGPFVSQYDVDLSGAVFQKAVTIEVAARQLHCLRTQWQSTATLRLRYATVDLSDAVLSSPVAVIAHPAPFEPRTLGAFYPYTANADVDEGALTRYDSGVRVNSVRGVDAAHLTLRDTDLTTCLISGAFHLDQLRLEGRCVFPEPPIGVRLHRIWPQRWTRRKTLAEEHYWRARAAGTDNPNPPRGVAHSSTLHRR